MKKRQNKHRSPQEKSRVQLEQELSKLEARQKEDREAVEKQCRILDAFSARDLD
jgi:hypothetical protein